MPSDLSLSLSPPVLHDPPTTCHDRDDDNDSNQFGVVVIVMVGQRR